MPKGGNSKNRGKKNTPPSSTGKIYRTDYSQPQATGLKVWIVPTLFHGMQTYQELAYNRQVVWYTPTSVSWVRHPEIGSMINQTSSGRSAIKHADYMWVKRQMSLSVWVYPTAVSGTRRIITKAVGTLNNQNEYDLRLSGSSVVFYFFSGATAYSVTGGSISVNKLYHLCGTLGASGAMKLYINGVLVATGDTPAGNSNNLNGDFATGAVASNFTGYVGDVRLYNRGLSAHEVWKLYDPATRWDLYDFIGGYGSSSPGNLPLPPTPPPVPSTVIVLDTA